VRNSRRVLVIATTFPHHTDDGQPRFVLRCMPSRCSCEWSSLRRDLPATRLRPASPKATEASGSPSQKKAPAQHRRSLDLKRPVLGYPHIATVIVDKLQGDLVSRPRPPKWRLVDSPKSLGVRVAICVEAFTDEQYAHCQLIPQ
jgi:hypothetical protein